GAHKSRSPLVGEVVANQSQFPVVTSDTQSEAEQVVGAGNNAVGLQPVSAMAQRKVAESVEAGAEVGVVVRIDAEVLVEGVGHPGSGPQQRLRGGDDRVHRVVL